MSSPERSGRPRSSVGFAERPVLEASPNPIVGVDDAGTITYANSRVESTFGYAREELIGQPIGLLLPERVRERHLVHRTRYMGNPIARPMGTGLELSGRRKDGTEFPVEISLSPVPSADGVQVFATVVDITARKSAEAALAQSERRFRTVLEASPNAIVGVDEEGRINYANPRVEATFGYTFDELIGQPIELLLPDRLHDQHVRHRSKFRAHPVARPMGIGLDLAGRRKDGVEFPVEISLSPVETPAGSQIFATVVDITARKRAQAELLQAQKLESIGRLAGGIAHDFNNVLFAIAGYGELLEQDLTTGDGNVDRDVALPYVQAIVEASRRGASLTRQLLAFSRQQVVSEQVLEINPAVQGVVPMLERLIGETNRLVLRLDSSPGRIKIDPGQLDQILVNLVVNSRDAMPEGGTITIETGSVQFDEWDATGHNQFAPGPYVQLAVTDTGIGMDRETRDHAFEPFFTTKERGRGTGLGLATIYGIVSQAGGHIWLYSEPGHGSTFKLYFPRVDEPASAERERPPADAPATTGLAIVVEDDETVRVMTGRLLERAGFSVVAVDGGQGALEAIAASPASPTVVVSDVVMPDMSGIELAECVLERDESVAVVLLSGYTAETLDVERVVARGVRFVSKPVARQDLLEAIRDAVSAAQARRAGGA